MQGQESSKPSTLEKASDRAGSPAARPFFFLHIRKTAGVSLRGIIANRFPADRILFQAHSVSGPQQPGDCSFATGHVDFDYARSFNVRPMIFTMLRDPILRCISTFDFFRSHGELHFSVLATELSETEYQGRRRFRDRARSLGMLRFLSEEETLARLSLANVQTRQLAGAACCAGLTDDDPRLLETALRHLAQIDLAGIVERLPDTLRLLGKIMHWGEFGPLQHLNRTAGSDSSAVDARCLEILRSWNQLDLRLYEEACGMFDSKLSALDGLPSDDALPDDAWPIDGDVYLPDQPIYGYGWHERELHQGRWLCWNSNPTATLNLRLSKARPLQFRCLLSHVINEAALLGLGIALNSIPLALRKREADGGILLESDIPEAAWTAEPHLARLTFECPVMARPCDIDPEFARRSSNLGIALSWLRLD